MPTPNSPTPPPVNPVFGGGSSGSGSVLGSGTGDASKVFGNKPVAPKKTGAAPKSDLPPVVNRAWWQDLIDALGSPLAFATGALSYDPTPNTPTILDLTAPSTTQRGSAEDWANVGNRIAGMFNAGVKNVTAPWEGRNREYGADALAKITGASTDATAGAGLVYDILADPLNSTPSGAVSGAIKAITKTGTTAAKAGVLAAKGFVPEVIAGKRAVTDVAPKIFNIPKSTINKSFTEASQDAGGELLRAKAPNLYKQKIVAPRLAAPRGIFETFSDIAKASAVGAYRGLRLSVSQSVLKEQLRTIGRDIAKEATQAKNKELYDYIPEALTAAEHVAQDVVAPAAETALKEAKPLLKPIDTQPLDNAVESIAQHITPKAIEESKAALDAANAVAKKIRVKLPDSVEVAGKVLDILKTAGKATRPVEAVSPTMVKNIKAAVKDPEAFSMQALISNAHPELAKIASRTFVAADGRELPLGSVFKAIQSGKRTFASLPAADQEAVRKAMSESISAPVASATSEQGIVKQISDLIGEKASREIISTGAAKSGLNTKNVAAVNDILKALPTGKTKGYKDAAAAIEGIRAGDNISPNSLFKLLQALDPENKIVLEGQKAATDANAVRAIKSLLVGKGANTIKDTIRRLNSMSPEFLLNEDHLPFSDVAKMAADRVLQGIYTTEPAVLRATRQEAMKTIESLESGETRKIVDRVREAIGDGLRTQGSKVVKALDAGAEIHENIWGRLAVSRIVDGKVQESYLPELFAQYTETSMLMNLVTHESVARDWAKKAAQKSKSAAPVTESRFSRLAKEYVVARATVLGTFGVRMVNVRAVKEAKSIDNGYSVYTDFGDFAETVAALEKAGDANGLAKSANEAFFPVDSGVKTGSSKVKDYRGSNSFSPQGVGRAVNKLLESMDKGKTYTKEEMVKDILTRGTTDKKKWSEAFSKAAPKRAADIADILIANKEFFATRHQERMLAEIEDMARPAQILAADTFTPIIDAARVYLERGTLTTEQHAQLTADALHKFAVGSDLLNQENGYIAMTSFRSAAKMFMTISGVDEVLKLSTNTVEDMPLAGRFLKAASLMRRNNDLSLEFQKFVDGINTYSIAMGKSENLIPYATKSVRDRLIGNLKDAEQAYQELALKLLNAAPGEDMVATQSNFKKAQTALDKARKAATDVGLPTRHWSIQRVTEGSPDGWVNSVKYNRAAEEEFLKQHASKLAADSIADAKPAAKLSSKEKKALAKQAKIDNVDTAASLIANGADDLAEKVAQAEQLFPDDEIEQGMRLAEEQATTVGRDSIIRVEGPAEFIYSTTYRDLKASRFGELNMEKAGPFSRFINGFGSTGSKAIANALKNSMESQLMSSVSDVHSALLSLMKSFEARQTTGAEFAKAFSIAAGGMKVVSGVKNIDELAKSLHKMMDATISQMKAMNVDPEILNVMLRKHGITPDNGFIDVRQLNEGGDLFNIFDHMPFSPKPEFDLETDAGRLASEEWDNRATKWAEYAKRRHQTGQADSAFSVMAKTIDSIQFAITQQSLGAEILNRFNHVAEGITKEEAIKRGYVKLTGSGNGMNLFSGAVDLGAEDGNLFHPEIAHSIAWVNREYNRIFNSKGMPNFLNGVMQMTQILKATQTVLRPGHWVATIVGDLITAMIGGAINPAHWGQAFAIAKSFASDNIKADTRIFGTIEDAVKRAVDSIEGVGGRAFEMTEKNGEQAFQFVIGGQRVKMSMSEIKKHLKDHNIVTGDIHVNDAAMLYQEIAAHAAGDVNGNAVVMNKLRNGFNRNRLGLIAQKIVKPAGDAVAYIGNVPRVAHALKVMQETSYNSAKQMFEAANEVINLYHPSVQSLSASERKARVAFSYYTWLRVAHNTAIDMLLNHTAAMMIPSKIFYTQSSAAGMQPQSVGNLWGDKVQTPEYLDNGVYGPTMTGVRGPMLFKPSILHLDVADTWKGLAYDPTMTLDENFFKGLREVGKIAVSQSNMVLQPVGQLLTGVNPSTGQPEQIQNLQQFADKYVGMVGFTKALQATGAYTPYKKIDNTTNPMTQRDRDIAGLNWLFGMRLQDINTPSNIKNAGTEQNGKMKRVSQIIADQTKGK